MRFDILIATAFWSFVPSALTSFIQKSLYKLKLLSPTPPQRQKSHAVFIFTSVIFCYFVFSVLKTLGEIEPNFYSVLDVPIDFKTKDLKVNYRSLSLQYHPDKNGHLAQDLKDVYHEKYLKIRKAYEILSDKNTLFAYEKFSDGIMECNNCRTRQDFMYHGLVNALAYHGFSNMIVFCMSFFSENSNSYWKFYYLFAQIVLEFYMLACNFTEIGILGHLTTGERIIVLRTIGVSGYMALNSLSSAWLSKTKSISDSVSEIGNLNRMNSGEIVKWYKWMYEPFSSDHNLQELRDKMKDYGFISRLSRSSSLEQLKQSKDNFQGSHVDSKAEILKKND